MNWTKGKLNQLFYNRSHFVSTTIKQGNIIKNQVWHFLKNNNKNFWWYFTFWQHNKASKDLTQKAQKAKKNVAENPKNAVPSH